MTPLRNQLQAARTEYRAIVFPGNLADLILIARQESQAWRISPARIAVAILALAASMALVIAPNIGSVFNASWLPSTTNLVSTREMSALPNQIRITRALLPAQPPSEIVSAIERPLVSCGSVFLNIGRDLAHRADALIHTM